ncbi:MAG TPA: hypothetical protein VGS19_08450 [Streptosporangiaceae bacterium]|nr:hypothetical protein [Streptosporangiaceae bacterium]
MPQLPLLELALLAAFTAAVFLHTYVVGAMTPAMMGDVHRLRH